MINSIKQAIRAGMRRLATWLNAASGGHISPNAVTIVGVLMHLPIAWFIADGAYISAALLLVIFGLFDALDGELARLQKRESARGMLLDSVTDRMKEIVLYTGAAWSIITTTGRPYLAVWAVVACGCSLLTSYVNAWGDAIMAKHPVREHVANKAFRGGLFPFEIRMVVLVLGLLSGRLTLAVIVIAIGAAYTALSRLMLVYRKLAA